MISLQYGGTPSIAMEAWTADPSIGDAFDSHPLQQEIVSCSRARRQRCAFQKSRFDPEEGFQKLQQRLVWGASNMGSVSVPFYSAGGALSVCWGCLAQL
eukprot:644311-Amphidinium_carterae.2